MLERFDQLAGRGRPAEERDGSGAVSLDGVELGVLIGEDQDLGRLLLVREPASSVEDVELARGGVEQDDIRRERFGLPGGLLGVEGDADDVEARASLEPRLERLHEQLLAAR